MMAPVDMGFECRPVAAAGRSHGRLGPAAICVMGVLGMTDARAFESLCAVGSIPSKPGVRVLQCGPELTITAERSADIQVFEGRGGLTGSVNSGAAEFRFAPSPRRPGLQILTPHATAAVRGTTWAVDVRLPNTAVFVETGAVSVTDHLRSGTVLLRAGEGVSVGGGEPLQASRWGKSRIQALLGRVGR